MAINQVSALMSWPDPEWLPDMAHIIWEAFFWSSMGGLYTWIASWRVIQSGWSTLEWLGSSFCSLGGLLLNSMMICHTAWVVYCIEYLDVMSCRLCGLLLASGDHHPCLFEFQPIIDVMIKPNQTHSIPSIQVTVVAVLVPPTYNIRYDEDHEHKRILCHYRLRVQRFTCINLQLNYEQIKKRKQLPPNYKKWWWKEGNI